MTRLRLGLPAILMAAAFAAPPAHGQTWVGSGSDWNTAGNWNPATIPNLASAVASFSNSLLVSFTPNISSSVQVQSL